MLISSMLYLNLLTLVEKVHQLLYISSYSLTQICGTENFYYVISYKDNMWLHN